MEIVTHIFFVLHMLGLAAVIGSFFFQLRRKSGFEFRIMLIGAITQLVTGLALVGLIQAAGDEELNNAKIAVKLGIAVVVLIAVIIGGSRQKKAGTGGLSEKIALPWLHIAGAGAIANVLVAALWA
jgi:hypothetical protein